jgi:monothiol glutaredoxin
MPLTETTKKQIADLVTNKPVVLFMKGNRHFPQCGFSAQVVAILDQLLPSYETVNVLSDPAIRDGIKEYSSWPTIPQLYIRGEFVGGCDIVKEMHGSGELAKKLGVEVPKVKAPKVTFTEAAAAAFKQAQADAGDDKLRLSINAQFEHELFFDPPQAGDFVIEMHGIGMHIDRASSARADGVTIDFVDQPGGGGFKIDNPNEPPRVKPITPKQLKAILDEGGAVEVFDVRPEAERALAKIDVAHSLEGEGRQRLAKLDKGARIVLHCHHGMRSRAAAEQLVRDGYRNVHNLEGGIEAWSAQVDPNVPRY